nr:FAD:protein FMN transferase [Candidatus Levybacteria bacterium]
MKKQTVSMGMPVIINVIDRGVTEQDFSQVFAYFNYIDNKFSIYKKDSEISKINRKELKEKDLSNDMKTIFSLSQKTKIETNGYFDINTNDFLDPSGIVKGYAILNGAKMLNKKYKNIYLEIAGDIQVFGKDERDQKWKIGIRNPFNKNEIIKVVNLSNKGIATSGTYERGAHIYNHKNKKKADEIASMTVIADNIYDADRFATAAFAMGEKGIEFIATLKGIEGYMIKKDKTAIFTKGFEAFVN